MKTKITSQFKKRWLAITLVLAIALICGVALAQTFGSENAAYAEDAPHIDFEVVASTDTITLGEGGADPSSYTVTYKITHNDGVNALWLMPCYSSGVIYNYEVTQYMILESVTVDNGTSLGEATVSNELNTKKGLKIALESDSKYSGTNETFITLTVRPNAEKLTQMGGSPTFKFGLVLSGTGMDNSCSKAYRYSMQRRTRRKETPAL